MEVLNSKFYFINTFGCQMNVADTERMEALLQESGMKRVDSPEQSDLIIVNGCSVREKAVHKAVSVLGRYRKIKKENKKPLIGLGGCVGQLEKDSIFLRAPYIDFVFGPDAIDELPEIIYQVENGGKHLVYTDFDSSARYSTETKISEGKTQAFVNIMKGCDKYCTYCIVPFTRGREKSRTIDEVVDDISRLVEQGVLEVTLLGQNVNSFGKGNANLKQREPSSLTSPIGRVGPGEEDENFPQLLRAIDEDSRCQNLKRIRFVSSHPLDFSDELVLCYAPVEKGGVRRLATHLHLPVQSGSNRVLRKMGRKHKIQTYIEQMDQLKRLNPEIGLSTDLIVGFPTETKEEFEETLGLLDRMQFDSVYAFAYSPRPGTRAAKLEDDVSLTEKKRRLNQLLDHQTKIGEKRYSSRIGRVMEVLVEGLAKSQRAGKVSEGESREVWNGRTSCNRIMPHSLFLTF